jgi:transposase
LDLEFSVTPLMAFLDRSSNYLKEEPFHRLSPCPYGEVLYKARKARHMIENFFAFLKQYRGMATCSDKRSRNSIGGIYLAASVILLA